MDKKILIVDDVMLATYFIKSHLEESGFTNIHCFNDSAEAWNDFAQSLLQDEGYDLVITDLNMPELDGMEFLKQIKSDTMCEKTPVIIVSADHDPIVMEEAKNLGALDYFTKPIEMDRLEQRIRALFK